MAAFMGVITGTSGNDQIAGTTGADEIYGGAGNDVVSSGDGNDVLYGEAGNDNMNGGAGEDILYGGIGVDVLSGHAGKDYLYAGDGNDGVYGGGDNDYLFGEAGDDGMAGDGGDDVIDGGLGNDRMYGITGNDTFIVRAGEGSDLIDGGAGLDTVVLQLGSADVSAFRGDAAGYDAWMNGLMATYGSTQGIATQTTTAGFTFSSLGLTVSAIEGLTIFVDGVATPLSAFLNQAPVAEAVVHVSTNEDASLGGTIGATDADGDDLAFSVSEGPSNGTLELDGATGSYVYTANANFSGADSFLVTVADGKGGVTSQLVNVEVAAVADAPALSTSDVTVAPSVNAAGTSGDDTIVGGAAADTLSGGAGNDTLRGDGPAAIATVALDIAAALNDTDGSEALSVVITGVPADATLSTGTRNVDGTWALTASQLSGLTMTASTAGDIALSVTAIATESSGAAATASATINVSFDQGGNADVLNGEDGADKLYGGAGDDQLTGGAGNDLVYGEAGDDVIVAGLGNDTYDGGLGFDTVDFSTAANAVTVDLSKSSSTGLGTDKITAIEAVEGSAFDDKITGSKVDNVLNGGNGADLLMGGAGNDTLNGAAGNDTLDGGSGNDTIYDGVGNDSVNGGSGDDRIFAGAGNDKYVGGSGFDTLDYSTAGAALSVDASKKAIAGWNSDTFDGIEKIIGSGFADTFKGSSGVNIFDGGAGDDNFRGMGGADRYTGGSGADTYKWYVKDVLSGTTHLGVDAISDFAAGDKLDLKEFTKAFKNANIDDVIHVTDTAQGSLISAKVGSAFVDVVVLEGVHGMSAGDLLASGMLLT
jgi:Ca2+-binding RTX toxin-like protein